MSMVVRMIKRMRLLLTIIISITSHASFGCSCAPWPPDPIDAVNEAYEYYPIIFLGHVESAEILPGEGELQETVFSVEKVWRGDIEGTLVSKIDISCCICGYQFEENISYLVFATETPNHSYRISTCSLTRPLSRAQDLINALNRTQDND